ncbi:MAG: hypothetical protein ACLFWL_16920 [Candidatus Brocadiia bacterium]
MTQNEQKRIERGHLNAFLNEMGISPQVRPVGDDPPDFRLNLDEDIVAVEHTEFHSDATDADGRPRRATEEDWKALRQMIRDQRDGQPELDNVLCRIQFRRFRVPRRRNHAAFANELVDFIYERLQELTAEGVFYDYFDGYPLLKKYVSFVQLGSIDFYVDWEWLNGAAFVGLTEDELSGAIDPKLDVDRPPDVDENWLLVVCGLNLSQDPGNPSVSEMNDYTELNRDLADGPYDRIYFYERMHSQILQWSNESGWRAIVERDRSA